MLLRKKKKKEPRYETSGIPVPEFSDNGKFLLSTILTAEIFGHNRMTQNRQSKIPKQGITFHFINSSFFLLLRLFPLSFKWIYNYFFTSLWEFVGFFCVHTLYLSLFIFSLLYHKVLISASLLFNTDIMYRATQKDHSVLLWLLCIW